MTVYISPLSPNRERKMEVTKIEFVTTDRLVPQRVVAKILSRFLSNLRVILIRDGGILWDFLNFLGSAAIKAISEPEKKASEIRSMKKTTIYKRTSIVALLFSF